MILSMFITQAFSQSIPNGLIRLKNRWKGNQYIHVEQPKPQAGVIQNGWWSAQWTLERIPNSPYYRIKNRWRTNQYIHAERPQLEIGAIKPGWWSAQWTLEPVRAGNKTYYKIKNRWKGTYLHIEKGKLELGKIAAGWWSAQWEFQSPSVRVPSGPNPPGPKPPQPPVAANSINDYIRGLSYDPARLLAVQPNGTTRTMIGNREERRNASNAVIICTVKDFNLTNNFEDISVLKPTNGVVYPGALLQANSSLAKGTPTPISSLKRAPMRLSIDLPGMGREGNFLVQNPNANSQVQASINTALNWWNNNKYREGYVNASNSTANFAVSYSSKQVALDLGVDLSSMGRSVSAEFSFTSTSEKKVTMAMFRQVFYTVTTDFPPNPADIFDKSVTVAQARSMMNNSNPPAYVHSVAYGRIIMLRMETTSSATEAELKATMSYASGVTNASGSLAAKYKQILANSNITVITIGGNASIASEAVFARNFGDLKPIITGKNAVYSKSNPGLPIAYTVRFLKDNSLAKMGSQTKYQSEECVKYNNGFVGFRHDGAYVAKFEINYTVDGRRKSWKSGNKTAGWQQQLSLPGNAKNVEVKAWAYTGLVWQPTNEIFNKTLNGPDNKTYKVWGTTLNPKWGN